MKEIDVIRVKNTRRHVTHLLPNYHHLHFNPEVAGVWVEVEEEDTQPSLTMEEEEEDTQPVRRREEEIEEEEEGAGADLGRRRRPVGA